MRKTQTDSVARLSVLIALTAAPAIAAVRIDNGVDWDAVPWASFCPGVEPVPLHTGAGDCRVSHPASQKHAAWNDFGMGTKEPPPNCEHAEHEYRWWTTPKQDRYHPTQPAHPWSACQTAWRSALNRRVHEPGSFSEPFEQWRARYFGPWLVGPAR